MNNEEQIEVLNSLIVINNDRIEGYETASGETEQSDLKNLFSGLQMTSKKCREQLMVEVERLGGTPDEGTRITGKFFRVWMDVKVALTSNDRKAILGSCEYGENVAQETYQKVFEEDSKSLTEEQSSMLHSQQTRLKIDYDTVSNLLASA
jgi:uncharacterized protein (TIGR02284 family)